MQVHQIQHQDNYYDCGLYTLTYMEFFAFGTPSEIRKGFNSQFPCDREVHMLWLDGNVRRNPNFLTKLWFNQRNGSNLRTTLMMDLLELMIKKSEADGTSQDLQKQIENARAYIRKFKADSTRCGLLFMRLVHVHNADRWNYCIVAKPETCMSSVPGSLALRLLGLPLLGL